MKSTTPPKPRSDRPTPASDLALWRMKDYSLLSIMNSQYDDNIIPHSFQCHGLPGNRSATGRALRRRQSSDLSIFLLVEIKDRSNPFLALADIRFCNAHVCFRPKADIPGCTVHVRFRGKNGRRWTKVHLQRTDRKPDRYCNGCYKIAVPGALFWFAPLQRNGTRSPSRKVGASASYRIESFRNVVPSCPMLDGTKV